MSQIRSLHSKKIYYFDGKSHSQNNPLKEFIYFLKSKGTHENIDFSYSNSQDSLHCHLTVRENLILDSIPTSLIKNSEIDLNQFISSLKNEPLKQLFHIIGDLNQPINSLSHKQIKIASLIKVILSDSKYIFLNNPEECLGVAELEAIKKALIFEVENNQRTLLFKSKRKLLWPEIVTNIITKSPQNKFIDSPNPIHAHTRAETTHTYSFTLNKKAS